MNVMRRALLYCVRQRTRTLALTLVLAMAGTLALMAVAVRDASLQSASDTRAAIGAKVILETDTGGNMSPLEETEWGSMSSYVGDLITPDVVEALAQVEDGTGYNVEEEAAYYGAATDFKYLPAALDISYTPYGQAAPYTATLSSAECAKFQSGAYRLVAGRHLVPEDVFCCLISKELADYNGLAVGDEVRLYSLDADAVTPFKVVGVFDGTEGTSGKEQLVSDIPANRGYLSIGALSELFGDWGYGCSQVTAFVGDPAQASTVLERVNALPELEGKTLRARVEAAELAAVSSPLASLQALMGWAAVLAIVAGAAATTALLALWVRGRSREIGILLSLGKGKAVIMAQFFAEALLAALAALVIAVGLCLAAAAVAFSSWKLVRARPRDVLANAD